MKTYVRNNPDSKNSFDKYKGNKEHSKKTYKHWSPPPHLTLYERSVWLQNSFTGRCVKARSNENVENLLRRFKKSVESAGIIRELKKREYHLSKTQKSREKAKRALKRLRKQMKKEQEEQELLDKEAAKAQNEAALRAKED